MKTNDNADTMQQGKTNDKLPHTNMSERKLEIQGNVKLFQKPDTWFVMQLGDMPISSLLVALMDALERL